MDTKFITSIDQIDAHEWNRLCGIDNPFLRHEFLAALETSGSVGPKTGWQPQHLLGYHKGALVAAMPLYIKHHSYGEYVFDWAWADAYQRHELAYYPKLLTAIPFTPSTGPRIGLDSGLDAEQTFQQIFTAATSLAAEQGYSSWHLLFPEEEALPHYQADDFNRRLGCQYHWFNEGYEDFDDFLSRLSSRKRKNIKRERRRVREQGIVFKTLEGPDINRQEMSIFYRFYQATYYKRARRGYLSPDFFHRLCETLPEQLVLMLAYRGDEPVAGALCMKSSSTLYGRYWGCIEEFECLHFETCYYRGIEYCIERGLQHFDPGAQGEHKILRGFKPIKTWSLHWIANPAFRQAIDHFLAEEQRGMRAYIEQAKTLLPFRKEN